MSSELRDAIIVYEARVGNFRHRVYVSPYIERNRWTVAYSCGPFFLIENSYEDEDSALMRARALATYLENNVLRVHSEYSRKS